MNFVDYKSSVKLSTSSDYDNIYVKSRKRKFCKSKKYTSKYNKMEWLDKMESFLMGAYDKKNRIAAFNNKKKSRVNSIYYDRETKDTLNNKDMECSEIDYLEYLDDINEDEDEYVDSDDDCDSLDSYCQLDIYYDKIDF